MSDLRDGVPASHVHFLRNVSNRKRRLSARALLIHGAAFEHTALFLRFRACYRGLCVNTFSV